MVDDWKRVTLANVIDLISGGTPKTSVPDYWGGDIPWLSVADFNTGYRWVNTTEKSITKRGLSESATTVLNQGDIIISARGTVGAVAQLSRDMAFNQSCYGVRGRSGIADTNFIYYALHRAVLTMKQVAHGGVFDTITRETFNHIELSLPPLPEQKVIADILGSLDDKIELNRRTNETLEAMAKAVFKSWFVDFLPVRANMARTQTGDPVHAKSKGRQPDLSAVPGTAQADGMDAETASLFPSSFQESEIGRVPKGWKASILGETFNLTMGQSPAGSTYNEDGDGLPFYQGRRDFGFRYPVLRIYCNAPTRIAQQDDTLVSVRAPVGDINMALTKCCIGRGVAAVRHRTGSRSYTYCSMQGLQSSLQQFEANGTVFGAINKDQFEGLAVVDPPDAIVRAFENMFSATDEEIGVLTKESDALSAARDALLPRLLSGEVRANGNNKAGEQLLQPKK